MRQDITGSVQKIRKVAHLADIHIRLFKRHAEYREAFDTLYTELRKKIGASKEWAIVVAGDIVHAKTDLSPEMVDIASDFLSKLADIAPTLVIAGNHDFNMANMSRLDSLSPIIQNIRHPQLHYLKHSGVYSLGGVDFAVHSIIGDEADWPSPAECTNGNSKVALFHGPVFSATTDVGFTVTSRHHTLDTFDGYDILMLGDIHKHQVLQEYDRAAGKPIAVYASSLIQQNHGEAPQGHGWCEWDIETRKFQFHELKNTHGYYTLRINDGKVPSYKDMPKNVYLRIFAGTMDQTQIKRLVTKLRGERNVIECSVSSFDGTKKTNGTTVTTSTFLDIHDVEYQNKLLVEFLKNAMPELSQETLDRVTALNKEKNGELSSEELARNVIWQPISLKYDNLFTYGESNSIAFSSLGGVVGIFAPNASGKTSIAEAICFALYDRTPRTQKAVNIMNTRKDTCYCEFVFNIGESRYTIERKGTRNKKGEVKIDVNFSRKDKDGNVESLNGEERRYTNKIIAQHVGEFEDFLLTTFSSSSSQGLFVDRGQSDRKDLLSQFMGLNIFDKLHTRTNDESKEIAGALKRFKNDDFTQNLSDVREEIEAVQWEAHKLDSEMSGLNVLVADADNIIQSMYEQKTPVKVKSTLEQIHGKSYTLSNQANLLMADKAQKENEILGVTAKLATAYDKVKNEYASVEQEYAELQAILGRIAEWERGQDTLNRNRTRNETLLTDLRKHTYDPNCQFCVLNGKDTISATERIEKEQRAINDQWDEIDAKLLEYKTKLAGFRDTEDRYKKLQAGKAWISGAELNKAKLETQLAQIESKMQIVEASIKETEIELNEWQNNQDAIKQNEVLDKAIAEAERKKSELKYQISTLNREHQNKLAKVAVSKQREQDMLKKIAEAEELESKYEAYEAYLHAVGRDGLPYKLIADVLPNIETAVNEILAQMVEFTLLFETDGKNINMKIRYDDERIWPSEMASGMEKFLISMAIRVALSSLSSLPKSNFLIVDEGFGTLDPDNIASVHMMFDVLRTKFDFILLISHIDAIRDVADTHVDIKRENGFSQIQVA